MLATARETDVATNKRNYISESFQQRADSAAFYEAWVGAMLSRRGMFTLHHPFTTVGETGNPASFYAHTWDLDVSPDNVVFTKIEVKSVNLKFTEPNDYPHLGVLVCSESSYVRKWPDGGSRLQRDFLTVSRLTGGIIWIPKGTILGRKEVTDLTRNETYWCKTVGKEFLQPLSAFVESIKSARDPWEKGVEHG